ncbi:DUF4157 domain-containing protein [uncultured Aquimarina sp.]|uniref:eCIS core domain-containing protein n=1 Tax=uncultured Aquimarina sp. TaxID=575652 RepID=UPI00261FFAB3|nr:DUF4157 domain-containing protein [uncultured Aquimarina sp.]
MKAPLENTREPQKETVQRVEQESSTGGEATISDNRPAIGVQRKLRSAMGGADDTDNPIQRKNNTGLPDNLKSGIENLSGYSMDDVNVHYNSSKPAQLQAHAYAQGTDIHLAPGQEKHLPHEAWHVVQQKQGRVRPTMQFKGKVNINDDAGLEKEADMMGEKALQESGGYFHKKYRSTTIPDSNQVLQGKFGFEFEFHVVLTSYNAADETYGPLSEDQYELSKGNGINMVKDSTTRIEAGEDVLGYDRMNHDKRNANIVEITTDPMDEFSPDIVPELMNLNQQIMLLVERLEGAVGNNRTLTQVVQGIDGMDLFEDTDDIRVGGLERGGQNTQKTLPQATMGVQLSKVQKHFEMSHLRGGVNAKGSKFENVVDAGNEIINELPSNIQKKISNSDRAILKSLVMLLSNYMIKFPTISHYLLSKNSVGMYLYKTQLSDIYSKLTDEGQNLISRNKKNLIKKIIEKTKSKRPEGKLYEIKNDPNEEDWDWNAHLNSLFGDKKDTIFEELIDDDGIESEEIGFEGNKEWAVIMENRHAKSFYQSPNFEEGYRIPTNQIKDYTFETLGYLQTLHNIPYKNETPVESEDISLPSVTGAVEVHENDTSEWNTHEAFERIVNSSYGDPSKIVSTNIEVQQKAKDFDGGDQMRESKKFTGVGYEFEFAQLAPELRTSDFGKKSHLLLAEGQRFPLFPDIPFRAETDMSAVIELAMPPILVPRRGNVDSGSSVTDREWIKRVLLKIEGGLKGLAKNGSNNLEAILKSVQTFMGLTESFDIKVTEDEDAMDAQYGFMQKNSKVRDKHTTAQANIVTSLEEAIKLSYMDDSNEEFLVPREIDVVRQLILERMDDKRDEDTKGYSIFVAQKISEIPYMFFDSLHAKSLQEIERNQEAAEEMETPTFNELNRLVGHEDFKWEENKVHERRDTEQEDLTKHATRTLVSKVKNRGYGWIKSSLKQQIKKFPFSLITASHSLLSFEKEKIKEALKENTAYRLMKKYAEANENSNIEKEYNSFIEDALYYFKIAFQFYSNSLVTFEKNQLKNTDEQNENPDNRYEITSARPDTIINLEDKNVAYKIDENSDAVLVEIRKATQSLGISYEERTTSNYQPRRHDDFIRKRAKIMLNYYNDENWVKAYKEASILNTDGRITIEKQIFELLALGDIKKAKKKLKKDLQIKNIDLDSDIFWSTILRSTPTCCCFM